MCDANRNSIDQCRRSSTALKCAHTKEEKSTQDKIDFILSKIIHVNGPLGPLSAALVFMKNTD